MIIQGPDFLIKDVNADSFIFDLYFLKVKNKGKEDQKYEFSPAGYGLKLATCLEWIINHRTYSRSKNLKEGLEDLQKLLKIWMEEKTKLLSSVDFSEEEWARISNLKKIPFDKLKQRDLIEAEIINDENDE